MLYSIIGSDNGLSMNMQLAITWTYDGLVYWCMYIYVSLSLSEPSSSDQIHYYKYS